jgi:glucose/arabinose dehydrogenase
MVPSTEEREMSSFDRFTGRAVSAPALFLALSTAGWFACSNTSGDGGGTGAGGSSATAGVGGTSPVTGGASMGGGTTGGATNGGVSNGGVSNGGTPSGGVTSGGTSNGGTSNGGTANGGAAGAGTSGGGMTSGGTSAGGSGGNVACNASAAPAIGRLGVQTIVQNTSMKVMVYASQPPGSSDWYLVDALGFVRVYSGGMLQATPFLDVSSEVQSSGFTGNGAPTGGSQNYDERGLLSIAFPPDYETSGKFYVTLIPTSGNATDHDLVLEYTRSSANPLVADPASRKAIVDLEPGGEGYVPGTAFSYAKYHNGSTVLFGPDGKLYFGFGDGGGDCNAARPGTPQDVASPYGKILRLDPNEPAPYAAAGNPFASGGDPRVLHYGLRNPFRFSFDSLNGDLYIGEVGQWTNDWVHHAPAGAMGVNFGWPAFEGVTENPTGQCASNTNLRAGSTRTAPIFNLAHGTQGGASNLIVATVGGAVYRGSAIPALFGVYLFAEFYPNRPVRALYQCGAETSDVTVIQKRCDPNTPNAACFTPVGGGAELAQVGHIVQGNDGELYVAANGNALMKIVPAP